MHPAKPVGPLVLILISLAAACPAVAGDQPSDAFLGDWQGEGLAAQVIPRGGGAYRINLLPEFDTRCEPLAIVRARADGDRLRFEQDGWAGELRGKRFAGTRPVEGRSVPFQLKKVVRPSPRLGAKAPQGAIVLFDGTDFDKWQVHRGKDPSQTIAWGLCDGYMRVAPTGSDPGPKHSLVTRQAFQDFQLHLEFRLPLMADKTGQARANGGVTLEDYNWYEVQILDSYGLEGRDNECGGVYKVAAPKVNMCRPPLQWQTYDIEFHAPRHDKQGNRVRPARISVNHNGKQIHSNVELPDSPRAQERRKADPTGVTAPRVILHYHGDPIEYRNIWAKPLDALQRPGAFATIGPALVKGDYHQYPPFYSTVIAPHAVVAAGKVYCAFQDTKGRPVVMVYDTDKRDWAGPVHASEFGLRRDAHGNPSICLDREGYIHIFYGCHGGAMRYVRSREPYDIGRWEEQPAPTSRATYPQSMLMADGSIYLFYRAGGHMEPWTFRQSGNGGRTWSAPEKIIEMRLAPPDPRAAAYCSFHPGRDGKSVHCFWVHKDDNAARVKGDRKHPWRPLKYKGLHEAVYRYNMYYIRRDAEGTWRSAVGKEVELPASKAFADEHCPVFDSGDEFTNVGRPMVDGRDRPYVRFRYGVGDWKAGGRAIVPWTSKFAHYASGRWQVHDDLPPQWPAEVRARAAAGGPAAYGDRSRGTWFIYFKSDRFKPDVATSIFLEHESLGYATRKGGPAELP